VVVHDKGWAVLFSLTIETEDVNQIAGTRVYISLFAASPRFPIPADLAAPQQQLFTFSGVVGSLPLMYGVNV